MSSTPAGSSAPPNTYEFPHIQSILSGAGEDGAAVAKEFELVYRTLRNAGALFACRRLIAVDPEVDSLRFDVIRDIVGPQQVLDELDHSRGGTSRKLSAWRNVFALLPLLLTWLALGLASLAYHQELAADSKLIGTPFLDLWQTGFGGRLGLTFAGTALIDLVLLTILVILTAWLHLAEGLEQRAATDVVGRLNDALARLAITMERHEKNAPKTDLKTVATSISSALGKVEGSMNSIVKANEQLVKAASESMNNAKTEVETFIQGLFTSVTATLETMKSGYQAFISGQTSSASAIFTEAHDQTKRLFVEQVGPTIASFSSTAGEYVRSAGTLSTAADTLGESAKTLGTTASSIDGHLVKLNTNIATVGLEAGGMRDAAQGVIDNNDQMKEMAKQVNIASQWMEYVTRHLEATSKALEETTTILRGIAPHYAARSSGGPPPRRWGPFGWGR
ncbi:MAG TPA: hypothetical protein VF116_01150 [Ktedonobacterales bacterium]